MQGISLFRKFFCSALFPVNKNNNVLYFQIVFLQRRNCLELACPVSNQIINNKDCFAFLESSLNGFFCPVILNLFSWINHWPASFKAQGSCNCNRSIRNSRNPVENKFFRNFF